MTPIYKPLPRIRIIDLRPTCGSVICNNEGTRARTLRQRYRHWLRRLADHYGEEDTEYLDAAAGCGNAVKARWAAHWEALRLKREDAARIAAERKAREMAIEESIWLEALVEEYGRRAGVVPVAGKVRQLRRIGA